MPYLQQPCPLDHSYHDGGNGGQLRILRGMGSVTDGEYDNRTASRLSAIASSPLRAGERADGSASTHSRTLTVGMAKAQAN